MSSNPMLNPKVMENVILDSKPMTIQGAINKTLILLAIVVASGAYTWNLLLNGFLDKANLFMIGAVIASLILGFVTIFNPKVAKITAPVYALCEGLLLGAVSCAYNQAFNGIALNAVGITVLALFVMLFLYTSGTIKATPMFRKVILISTIAVFIFYLAGWIGQLFGHPMTVFNGSLMGIVISAVICLVAAFNFIIDFDIIEQGERNNLPDYFEWYGGFALLVTMIWLYIEVLRLLAQLQNRD